MFVHTKRRIAIGCCQKSYNYIEAAQPNKVHLCKGTHVFLCVPVFLFVAFVWVVEYVVERSTAHSSHKIQIWEQTEWNVIIAKHTHECPHKYLYSLPLFILTLLLSLSHGHTSTNRGDLIEIECVFCICATYSIVDCIKCTFFNWSEFHCCCRRRLLLFLICA